MNQKSIDFFKSIFENFPNLTILNINHNLDEIKVILENIVKNSNGTFTNIEFNTIDENNFKTTIRDYEYAVLSNCLDLIKNKKQFLLKIYNNIENSAQIIILVKKNSIDLYKLKEILEDLNFLAPSEIDIFEDYDLITAKKMRMWV